MTEYTPSTGDVRAAYARAMRQAFITSTAEHIAEFDRWLARERAEVWDEAISDAAEQGTIQIPDNPYRGGGPA